MFRFRIVRGFALGFLTAFLISAPAHASDLVYPGGGTLAQIVDGGGTNTIITLVNLQNTSSPCTLYFYDDNGNPLTLSTTAGMGSSVPCALGPNSSLIVQTNGGGPNVLSGYAVVATEQAVVSPGTGAVISFGAQVAGSAVFSLPLAGGVTAQASCPLDTGENYLVGLPFDETGDSASAQTGVALVNSLAPADITGQPFGVGETATVSVSILDQNGNQIPTPSGQSTNITLTFGQHMSFMLDTMFPQIKGQKGTVIFNSSDSSGQSYNVKVLGLRATATTFTSITPIVPCIPQGVMGFAIVFCTNY